MDPDDDEKRNTSLWRKLKTASAIVTPRNPPSRRQQTKTSNPDGQDVEQAPLLVEIPSSPSTPRLLDEDKSGLKLRRRNNIEIDERADDIGQRLNTDGTGSIRDVESPPPPLSPSAFSGIGRRMHHQQTVLEHFITFIQYRLETTALSQYWELLDLGLNALLVVLYIWNTHYSNKIEEGPDEHLPDALRILDISLACALFVQFMPRFFLTSTTSNSVAESSTMLMLLMTFMTTAPVLMALADRDDTKDTYMAAGPYVYMFPFRFVRLHMATMASLTPSKTSDILQFSLITRKSIRLITFILLLILTTAAFVHVVAYKAQGVANLTFFDSFYFAIVSATSGTTHQIVPDSAFSRMVILYIMFSGAFFIPTRLSELLTLMSKKSAFDHSYKIQDRSKGRWIWDWFVSTMNSWWRACTRRRRHNSYYAWEDDALEVGSVEHVVIVGHFDAPYTTLHTFLSELFSTDHISPTNPTRLNAIILNPAEPTDQFKERILEDKQWGPRVKYVKGSVMDVRGLIKVRMREARACFVFSRRWVSANSAYESGGSMNEGVFEEGGNAYLHAIREEDAVAVMRALAIRKWVGKHRDPGTSMIRKRRFKVHVQVLLPENKVHFDYLADTMVCVEELKLGILAQNIRCPGFTTLIHNLTTSLTLQNAKRLLGVQQNLAGESRAHVQVALKEYLQGANQEVYPMELGRAYRRYTFAQVSVRIYTSFGAVMFALGIPNEAYRDKVDRRHFAIKQLRKLDSRPSDVGLEAERKLLMMELEDTQIEAEDFDLYLNPAEYILNGDEMAFVIAQDDETVSRMVRLEDEEIDEVLSGTPRYAMPGALRSERAAENAISAIWEKLKQRKSKGKTRLDPVLEQRGLDQKAGGGSFAAASASKASPTQSKKKTPLRNHAFFKEGEEELDTSPTTSQASLQEVKVKLGSAKYQDDPDSADEDGPTIAEGSLGMRQGEIAAGAKDALPTDLFADIHEQIDEEVAEEQREASASSATDQNVLSQVVQNMDDMNIVAKILKNAIGASQVPLLEPAVRGSTIFGAVRGRSMTSSSNSSSFDINQARYPHLLPARISAHILVCDSSPTFPGNLEYFIAPLRSSHLNQVEEEWSRPIVVLSPIQPNEHQKRMLEKFQEVYVICGDPMSRKDLNRAGVDRCMKAVVFANSAKAMSEPERTSDASALLTVLNIEAMAREDDLFIVTEFIHYENMMFVGESDVTAKTSAEVYSRTMMRPAFMAGHVFSQSMLDTVICQNFYNPHLLNILRHLIFSGNFHTQNQLNRDDNQAMHSHCWLIRIPNVLVGTKYVDLYAYLAQEHNAIPLGLYRRVAKSSRPASQNVSASAVPPGMAREARSTTNSGNHSVMGYRRRPVSTGDPSDQDISHHYVYANPAPGTRIRVDDRVYVLSVRKPVL